MGFFDSIGDAFNNAKNKASNVIDTGRNKLEGATRFSSRIAHSAASTVRREFNDTTRAVKRTGTSVANVARREFNDTTRAVKKTTNSVANVARREWNDTTRAVKKTTNSVANVARREWNDTTRAVKRTGTSVANVARREWNDTTRAVKKTTNSVASVARREWNDTTRAVKRTGTSVANVARREWNDTTRAVKKTTNSAFNTVRQVNLSNVGHTVLDGAGFIPVVGGVADLANAGWYAANGDKVNAALSAASAIPFAGDAFAAGKLATKGAKLVKNANGGRTFITYTLRDSDQVVRYVGKASGKGTPEQVMKGRISRGHDILKENPNLKPHIDAVQGNSAANKGAEEVLYSRHQIPSPKPIDGRTLAGGANTDGIQLLNRTNTQSNKPWKARTIGKRNIEAYAKDLKQP